MTTTRRRLITGALTATALVALSACGSSAASSGTVEPSKPLTIVADSVPHSELLKQVQKLNLLGDVKIEIREIAGGVDPNQLVESGDVDANFFQHVPYLKDWNASHKGDLIVAATTHVEPLGLYSRRSRRSPTHQLVRSSRSRPTRPTSDAHCSSLSRLASSHSTSRRTIRNSTLAR